MKTLYKYLHRYDTRQELTNYLHRQFQELGIRDVIAYTNFTRGDFELCIKIYYNKEDLKYEFTYLGVLPSGKLSFYYPSKFKIDLMGEIRGWVRLK